MAESSKGGPDTPVFVDNTGGRRRTWRRLGMAMGVAGGGYALAVVVSVIGGNSDAPWVLIPDGTTDRSDSVRVVPQPDETDGFAPEPGAGPASPGQPSPSVSASASSGNDTVRTSGSNDAPAARETADGQTKVLPPTDSSGGASGGGEAPGGSAGGQGGAAPAPVEPASGGGSASPGTSGDPEPEPTESPSDSGLLEGVVDPLGGVMAAGAE